MSFRARIAVGSAAAVALSIVFMLLLGMAVAWAGIVGVNVAAAWGARRHR